MAPTVVGLVVFRLGPILSAIGLSFTEWNVISPPRWIGLANYVELLNSDAFWAVGRNTVLFSVTYVLGVTSVGLALALLVNKKLRGISFFRTTFYLPVITSTVAVGVIWSWILSPRFGLVSQFLTRIGLGTGPGFLTDERLVLFTVALVYVWKMSGYQMTLFLGGLQSISPEYYEAARIDGATGGQMFRHVTLPLLSPTTFFVVVVSLIQSLQTFDVTYSLTGGGPNGASSTLVYEIYTNAFIHFRMGLACAMAFVLLLVVGAITYLNFKFRDRWVHTSE